MINFKKGLGLTINQPDKVGNYVASEGVVQGMICHIDNTTGNVIKGSLSAATELLGFAINDGTQADVLASNAIGLYTLDGQAVVETDQVTGTITSFAIGALITPDGTTGKVKAAGGGDYAIGKVEGFRSLQGTELLGIKLFAA